MAVTLLNQRNVPKRFWGDAVLHAVYVLNRTPKPSREGRVTCEVQSGGRTKSNVEKLIVFGCLSYVYQQHHHEPYGKYDVAAIPGMYLGESKDDLNSKFLFEKVVNLRKVWV